MALVPRTIRRRRRGNEPSRTSQYPPTDGSGWPLQDGSLYWDTSGRSQNGVAWYKSGGLIRKLLFENYPREVKHPLGPLLVCQCKKFTLRAHRFARLPQAAWVCPRTGHTGPCLRGEGSISEEAAIARLAAGGIITKGAFSATDTSTVRSEYEEQAIAQLGETVATAIFKQKILSQSNLTDRACYLARTRGLNEKILVPEDQQLRAILDEFESLVSIDVPEGAPAPVASPVPVWATSDTWDEHWDGCGVPDPTIGPLPDDILAKHIALVRQPDLGFVNKGQVEPFLLVDEAAGDLRHEIYGRDRGVDDLWRDDGSQPIWTMDGTFHMSVERRAHGTALWNLGRQLRSAPTNPPRFGASIFAFVDGHKADGTVTKSRGSWRRCDYFSVRRTVERASLARGGWHALNPDTGRIEVDPACQPWYDAFMADPAARRALAIGTLRTVPNARREPLERAAAAAVAAREKADADAAAAAALADSTPITLCPRTSAALARFFSASNVFKKSPAAQQLLRELQAGGAFSDVQIPEPRPRRRRRVAQASLERNVRRRLDNDS